MKVSGPGQPVHLLLDVADLLNEVAIPYAVIGALAVSFHGIPRATNDADAIIWLQRTGRTAATLAELLTQAGYRVATRLGDSDDPIEGVIEIEDLFQNRVDLMLGIRSMDPGAVQRRITATFLGCPLTVVGLEDLVALKLFAGGPQDIEDVKGILQVSKDHLNSELVRALASHYGPDIRKRLEAVAGR